MADLTGMDRKTRQEQGPVPRPNADAQAYVRPPPAAKATAEAEAAAAAPVARAVPVYLNGCGPTPGKSKFGPVSFVKDVARTTEITPILMRHVWQSAQHENRSCN